MPNLRISEAAALLGVSDDTLRRWIDQGRLESVVLDNGRKGVSGTALAAFAQTMTDIAEPGVLAVLDSLELLEVAVRNGSAAAVLGIGRGEPVALR